MFRTVDVPLWLLCLILLFAAITAGSHLLFPSVRWFLRRRMERAVERLNTRLDRPIQPFKLARRHDTIQRLIYDPQVAQAIADHARDTGTRPDVAFAQARGYAREIVPAFSASIYFGVAIRWARWLARVLYDVRITGEDLEPLSPDATIVYVMNHRSNMDYVLVTYLAAQRTALTYAVGEWARVWPLSALVRTMGAYFIRRRSRNPLYRKVLARYVQMATQGGVTQAIFPEGGLSLSGYAAAPRLGLLSYIASAEIGAGDVIFVPISLNYDRVIEDRILTEAHRAGHPRFRASALTATLFVLRWAWRRATGQVRRFGVAAVAFGAPLSLRAAQADGPVDVAALAETLMSRIVANVPVLPVPLVAAALQDGASDADAVAAWIVARLPDLRAGGRAVHLVDDCPRATARAGLDMLTLRRIVVPGADRRLGVPPDKGALLAFYAASLGNTAPQP